MKIRTFRAPSLQEALQQVREALGPGASVLQMRELKTKSRFGRRTSSVFEVEASAEVVVQSRFAAQGKQRPSDTSQIASTAHSQEPEQTRLVSNPLATRFDGTVTAATLPPFDASSAAGQLFHDLVGYGIDAATASTLIAAATSEDSGGEQDYEALRSRVVQQLADRLATGGSIPMQADQPTVVAFVGPTGVGKTTTLAKIASEIRASSDCNIGLMTMDTSRRGAVDQLLYFAERLSASLEVVSDPRQVKSALKRLDDCRLVLIDTAGRGPADTGQLRLLKELLSAAQPDSTHLVLSAVSSSAAIRDAIHRFRLLGPTHLIISKLDECVDFGSWLTHLLSTELPVSYLTTGQMCAGGLTVADGLRLAAALTGGES